MIPRLKYLLIGALRQVPRHPSDFKARSVAGDFPFGAEVCCY